MGKQAKETANVKPKRKSQPMKIFSKEFSEWARNAGTNPYVNNYKNGGGRSPRD